MRKFFGFGRHKVKISSTIQQRNGADTAPECSSRVSSGPKYHIRDKDLGKIHKAASAGNVQKVQEILLRKKKCLNDRDKKNRTALHLACANGHPEVVTLLTDNKCELNYCDNDNRTALMKAIQCQQEECAAILITCGADPNVADIDGNTALHFAVAGHHMEIAEELLLNKADIEAKNKDDFTPLLLAIHEHRYKMAKFLMARNANVHAVDRFKRTSLMLAVNDSSSDLLKQLLQEGVDVLAKDIKGSTAEEHALKTGLIFNHKLIRDYKEEMIHKQSSEHSSQAKGFHLEVNSCFYIVICLIENVTKTRNSTTTSWYHNQMANCENLETLPVNSNPEETVF
ncbi:ankyrin repeat domain-containing protein 7-like [Rousettus aegyptiacus]|uniref:ankyrin repeat domain-containing protein 7-like n=1 Tax=Rousettus aegyptiacus TaxID=9407 RepID=UPI00168D5126|nr:ankyrin repeat domain-containing protein 7-like [Rousettus aegyptiacus]